MSKRPTYDEHQGHPEEGIKGCGWCRDEARHPRVRARLLGIDKQAPVIGKGLLSDAATSSGRHTRRMIPFGDVE